MMRNRALLDRDRYPAVGLRTELRPRHTRTAIRCSLWLSRFSWLAVGR
jgi:hypothetical protein